MSKLAPYAKAVVGALIAALASLQQALDGDNTVTAQEWTGVAIAVLSGLALVWAIPNRDPEASHQDESVQPPQHRRSELGESALTVALVVLIAVIVLVILVPAL